jgi:hypothetical protein
MNVTIEYKLCAAETAEDLNREVNKLLAEGWALYGNPFVSPLGTGTKSLLCQAVTKMPKKIAGVR